VREPSVLVTGGSGHVGSHVVGEFQAHGYRVTNADLYPSPDLTTVEVDATDLGALLRVPGRFDAIVHLVAIPTLTGQQPQEVLRVNVMAAHNVLEFSCQRQVGTAVMASSEAVIGVAFGYKPVSPVFLPIDESHPVLAEDAYGLSRLVQENLAAGFARRVPGMSVINLRFAWMLGANPYRDTLTRFHARPAEAVRNLFAYVGVRDGCRVMRLAVEHPPGGAEVCFVTAADSFMPVPSRQLAAEYFPAARLSAGFTGGQSLIDCRKARELLGFEPAHTWSERM
jgi:nucleoside-diphosphate-sugar epimerase